MPSVPVLLSVVFAAVGIAVHLIRRSGGIAASLVSSSLPPQLEKPTWNSSQILQPVYDSATLALNDGKEGRPALLVILGEIYNVTGVKTYMGDSGYSVFVGRDATSAFATGKFNASERLDDVSGLSVAQMRSIEHWIDFYRKHENYTFVGVHNALYYNEQGKRTKHWHKAYVAIRAGQKEHNVQEDLAKLYPHCNTKWSDSEGHVVDCPQPKGSSRVPRILVTGSTQRCACVDPTENLAHLALHLYPDCLPLDTICRPKTIPDMREKQAPVN